MRAGSKGTVYVKGAQLLPDQLSDFVRGRLVNLMRRAAEPEDDSTLPGAGEQSFISMGAQSCMQKLFHSIGEQLL